MKKAKNLIKNNIKLLIGFILGIIISAGGVYAAIVIQGSSVGYTDNYSLGATTVQGAIDKLSTKVSTFIDPSPYDTPSKYACSSSISYYGFTSTRPSNKKVYHAYYSKSGNYGACGLINGSEYCFISNDFQAVKAQVINAFGANNCTESNSYAVCYYSDFKIEVHASGAVNVCYNPDAKCASVNYSQTGSCSL